MGVYSKIKRLFTARTNQADKQSPRSEPFWDNWPRETLGQQLTNLLVDNGSSVNKQSILALKGFLAQRDKEIIDHAIKQHETGIMRLGIARSSLEAETGVSDLELNDLDTKTKGNSKPQRTL